LRDCTRTLNHHSHSRLSLLFAASVAILALVAGASAQLARADGDPASDVLASYPLFLPQDAGVPPGQQAQLAELLAAAGRSGYQLRVALIASPTDLGSVTELWRQPMDYAKFLGQELSLVYRGALLVVMPNGYGLYRLAGPIGTDRAALAGVGAPGGQLGSATLTAVQRLAAASGHPLSLPAAAARSTAGSADALPWVVFALGSALIVLAWAASLHARPLHPPRP
jgi:hypothetical protein